MGMVNFLSMFCPELQKLLKPIYDLTRKGRPFIWGKEQQDSFEDIKCRLIKPPVLHILHINCICEQKTPRTGKELLYNRIRIMWLGHKYSKLFTLT